MNFAQKVYDEYKGQYSIIKDVWHNNVRHCIENQLDYTHLATVHKKTIGRGYKIPKNIELIVDDNYIDVYRDNKLMLKYIHANSWLLNNADSMNIYVYFAPINEQETKIYVLSYRNFLNAKIIKPIMDMVFRVTNKHILNEDKRVVMTQKYDDKYNNNDFLLRHDQIIKEFRKKWPD